MRSRSAFSLVEVVIVMVIIGLMVAMVIPAFQKVRDDVIVKTAKRGDHLTESEIKRYREIMREKAARGEDTSPVLNAETPSPQFSTPIPFQRVTIDGVTFYLIPKQEARETEIAGKTFWLIPSQ